MRLIDVNTLELVEFFDELLPPYAILSHRWQAASAEVSFFDIQNGRAKDKSADQNLLNTCRLAREKNIPYVWVDTCCIDKSSSADLSESINSMFQYYLQSAICFAYLYDVDTTQSGNPDFPASSWFSRSWTLQELIAPKEAEFYDQAWRPFGRRSSPDIVDTIVEVTGIGGAILDGVGSIKAKLRQHCIATKMSWASRRVASRREDIAYSLLGIFEVNMPLLYGEGDGAFLRLQEALMRKSDDHTLFAWSSSEDCQRGLLAKTPRNFENCGEATEYKTTRHHRAPYHFTNMGLSIDFLMVPWAMDIYLAVLNVAINGPCGILLKRLDDHGQYARVKHGTDIVNIQSKALRRAIVTKVFVRQQVWGNPVQPQALGFWIRTLPKNHAVIRVYARNTWDETRMLEIPPGERAAAGVIQFSSPAGDFSELKLGFDVDFNTNIRAVGSLWTGHTISDSQDSLLHQSSDHLDSAWISSKIRAMKPWVEGHHASVPHRTMYTVHEVDYHTAKLIISEEEIKGIITRIVDIVEKDSALDTCLDELSS